MAIIDKIYMSCAKNILMQGYVYTDKSRDINMKQVSSMTLNIPVKEEFPLLTTKEMHFHSIVTELLWFLRGETNIKYLIDHGVRIWNKDAYNFYLRNLSQLEEQNGPMSFKEFIDTIKENTMEELISDYCIGKDGYEYVLGDVGRNYGALWTSWIDTSSEVESGDYCEGRINQLENLVFNLAQRPMSRRHIVTAWNPGELDSTALPPCHWSWEIIPRPLFAWERIEMLVNQGGYVTTDDLKSAEEEHAIADNYNIPKMGFLLKWHQRSVDTFLGLPFNIASYALLGMILEQITGLSFLGLSADLSNVHFYQPHVEKVQEQILRSPDRYTGAKVKFSETASLLLKGDKSLKEKIQFLSPSDFELENYGSYDKLTAEMYEPKV